MPKMRVIAHRGLYWKDYTEDGQVKTGRLYREQSLPSLLVAALRGLDVEFDVHSLMSGQALVHHDKVVVGPSGTVIDIAETKLPILCATGLVGTGPEQIPLLTDILSSLAWRSHLHIELKGVRSSIATADALRAVGATTENLTNVTVSSFALSELERFHAQFPTVELAWLRSSEHVVQPDKLQGVIFNHGISAVHIPLQDFTEELAKWYVETCRVMVRVWTVNDPVVAVNLAHTGLVDGIFTDFANEIRAALQN